MGSILSAGTTVTKEIIAQRMKWNWIDRQILCCTSYYILVLYFKPILQKLITIFELLCIVQE